MSGGFLIRPQEIDEALCKHAAVKSSVTIAWPDTYFGEVPVSVVETDDASCNENALMLHARDVLEPLKLPKRIVMVQSIPRGDAGKPNLSEVQELVQLYIQAARNAMDAGFDGIELQGVELEISADAMFLVIYLVKLVSFQIMEIQTLMLTNTFSQGKPFLLKKQQLEYKEVLL